MNNLLATIITGLVIDENAKAYFVQKDGVTFMLDKAEGEHKIGDMVKGFAYTDVHQKARLTTADVATTRTTYGWGVVTEVRRDLGVFLDTGLADKQFVVSLDVLPDMKELWPKKVINSMFIWMWIKKTVSGQFQRSQKFSKKWLDLLTIICKMKNCAPLSIV